MKGNHNLHFKPNVGLAAGMDLEKMTTTAAAQVAKLLYLDAPIGTDQPLISLGVDSLISVRIVFRLKSFEQFN